MIPHADPAPRCNVSGISSCGYYEGVYGPIIEEAVTRSFYRRIAVNCQGRACWAYTNQANVRPKIAASYATVSRIAGSIGCYVKKTCWIDRCGFVEDVKGVVIASAAIVYNVFECTDVDWHEEAG